LVGKEIGRQTKLCTYSKENISFLGGREKRPRGELGRI